MFCTVEPAKQSQSTLSITSSKHLLEANCKCSPVHFQLTSFISASSASLSLANAVLCRFTAEQIDS